MLHQCWSVTWVCFSQSDSSSDNGGLCTVQYRRCTVCTAASPLSADPSLILSQSHSASVSSEWHKALHLASVLCSRCTTVQCSTRPPQLATSTLYKSRGCCCNFIHIHYLYLRPRVITISDKISPKYDNLTLDCIYHLVTMFQIVVQCPGLCCSLVPFIDPRQPRRLAGGARACSVCTRPLVRHHNIICDQWRERTEIRPFFTF